MTQHTGDTINKLAEAVERAEQRSATQNLCSVCERPAPEPLTSEFLPGYIYCSESCRDQAEMEALSGMLKMLG